jgi:hypothetical protein
MVGWLWLVDSKRYRRKWLSCLWRYSLVIYLERLKRTTRNLGDKRPIPFSCLIPGLTLVKLRPHNPRRIAGAVCDHDTDTHRTWSDRNLYLSMALQPFVGPWPPSFSFLIYTKSVGLLGREISPSQGRYLHTEQHTHRINAHRHACFEWNSNPRSQCSSKPRQFGTGICIDAYMYNSQYPSVRHALYLGN